MAIIRRSQILYVSKRKPTRDPILTSAPSKEIAPSVVPRTGQWVGRGQVGRIPNISKLGRPSIFDIPLGKSGLKLGHLFGAKKI